MSSYQDILNMVNEIEIWDTHEHVAGFDWGFATPDAPIGPTHPRKSLPHVLMNDMILYILGAARYNGPSLAGSDWQIEQAADYWKAVQPILEEVRAASVYTLVRRGIQELYGFEGDDIDDSNFEALNAKITATYDAKGAPAWLFEVVKKAKVKRFIQMAHLPYSIQYWPSLEPERQALERSIVRPSLVLESFFFSGFEPDRSRAREATMELLNIFPKNYEEHLEFMHAAVKRHKHEGGAALKFLCAYQRTLHFEQVPDDEARRLYSKGYKNLEPAELHRLQDNLAWHLGRLAAEFELPIQIHTGYSTPATLGHPETLYNFVTHPNHRKVNFYFCHAGWPHDGQLSLMARSFPNVYFGMCWLPGLSVALAERLLDEVFDCVPANKIMTGMDAGTVENFYGTALVTRELTAKVLAKKVDEGHISRRAAHTVAHRYLHDNALEVFGD